MDQPGVCEWTDTAIQIRPPFSVTLATTIVQTDEDIGETIRQYKEEIAMHKAIVEKVKEHYEHTQAEAIKSKKLCTRKLNLRRRFKNRRLRFGRQNRK